MENPAAMSAFVGFCRLLSTSRGVEGPRTIRGPDRETKIQAWKIPAAISFSYSPCQRTNIEQKPVHRLCQGAATVSSGSVCLMSALPHKADIFQHWRLCPLMTHSGHSLIICLSKGILKTSVNRPDSCYFEIRRLTLTGRFCRSPNGQ